MATNTNFKKPIPPGKKRNKKKQSRNTPSPVITTIQPVPIDSIPPRQIPQRYKRKSAATPNTYRYQNRGPPKKALPSFSQTPTPTINTAYNRVSPHIRPQSNGDISPLPLEMSQTTHVSTTHNIVNSTNRHLNPQTMMNKTVSANDIVDYIPITNKSLAQDEKQNTYNANPFIPPPPQHTYNNHNGHDMKRKSNRKSNADQRYKEHNGRNQYNVKKRKRKSNADKSQRNNHIQSESMPMTPQIHTKYSNEKKQPSIDTMKQLIERAETFGQTQRNSVHRNNNITSNEIHSNQAPQMPANNSIFDASDSDNENHDNSMGNGMEYKENRVARESTSIPPPSIPPPSMTQLESTNSKDSIKIVNRNSNHKKSIDGQIGELKDEINGLEGLLKHKRKELSIIEKEKLESSIEYMKPITLLKRFNQFCDIADGEELDLIKDILAQSVQ